MLDNQAHTECDLGEIIGYYTNVRISLISISVNLRINSKHVDYMCKLFSEDESHTITTHSHVTKCHVQGSQ